MADQLGAVDDRSRVLLIESDEPYRAAIGACIQVAGGLTEHVHDVSAALGAIERQEFDLLVWGASASEAVRRAATIALLQSAAHAPLIVVDDSEMAEVALGAGAAQWVPKPFIPGALVAAIRVALKTSAGPGPRSPKAGLAKVRRTHGKANRSHPPQAGLWAAISSQAEDATLFSASGGYERGWRQVGPRLAELVVAIPNAYSVELLAEHVSDDLACTVEILRSEQSLADGGGPALVDLRVTYVYRREAGQWKVVHRHADPLLERTDQSDARTLRVLA
jgi:ketosteroid isomerase-like protein/CheY-like chemotaxis protein